MKIRVKPHLGTHRFEYDVAWYRWAFPLAIGIGTSWYPNGTSTLDPGTWDIQRVLLVDVLCCRMRVVIQGVLFPDEED